MPDLTSQSWFWPALIVVFGLPILLLLTTELAAALTRRDHPAARTVRFVRNWLLPFGALLLLVSQVTVTPGSFTWTRVVATLFGFLLIVAVLNAVNSFLFRSATPGTWRDRVPSIFTDLLRLILIIVGLGALFAIVWGADVGGLFTALGVGSVVIGLALQNAVGPVVSGLFLLFEQPFRLGDWLDAEGVRGRVVEVNWRSVHIDTGAGIQIIPNGTLAGASFRNLSRAGEAFPVDAVVAFASDDPPFDVVALLRRVADGLPMLVRGGTPTARLLGDSKYAIGIPVVGPAMEEPTISLYLSWLWYAARRAGLHLDGDLTDDYDTAERRSELLQELAPTLRLDAEELPALLDVIRLERYGAGETLQLAGEIPTSMGIIARGRVQALSPTDDGSLVRIGQLAQNEMIGMAAITRQPVGLNYVALDDLTVLRIPASDMIELTRRKPALARQIGQELDLRRKAVAEALSALTAPSHPDAR